MSDQEDTVPVENMDQFVRFLAAWHAEKCQVVQHMLNVPEGAEFRVGDSEGEELIVLTPAVLAGYKLGIEMAMMQLGTLPFVAEMEEEEAEPVPG